MNKLHFCRIESSQKFNTNRQGVKNFELIFRYAAFDGSTMYYSLSLTMMHMTYFEKSIENFLNQLEFDVDFYDVLSGSQLMDYTRDFLSSYNIEITEGCDYRNDKNDNGRYYCDMASERADSQVDIYHSDLWEKAPKFQCRIEEAISDFWSDKPQNLINVFQMGQYLYYSQLS